MINSNNLVLTPELQDKFSIWLRYDCDLRPRSIDSNIKRVHYLSKYLAEKAFTQETCRDYIIHLKELKYKPSTISNARYSIAKFNTFLEYQYKDYSNFTDTLPVIKVREQPIETLTPEEISAIIHCKRNYRHAGLQEFWDTVLSLIARTGRRVEEISKIKVQDLDTSRNALLLRDPKNGQPSWIPIPRDLSERLQTLSEKKQPEDDIFINRFTFGKAVSTTSIRNELKERARLVGIKKRVHPHMFRHSYPAELLRMGVPLPQVQRLMGHKRVASTLKYVHLVLNDLQDASRLHPLNQAELTPEDIVNALEKDMRKYSLSSRYNIDLEVIRKSKRFTFTVKWG